MAAVPLGAPLLAALPSLPAVGPLRVLAISGSIAMLCFVVVVWQQRATPAALRLALVPLALAVTTMALRGHLPWLHSYIAIAAAVAALYNAWQFKGLSRVFSVGGAIAWIVALASARRLFG